MPLACQQLLGASCHIEIWLTQFFVYRLPTDSEEQGSLCEFILWQTAFSSDLVLTLSAFYSFSPARKQGAPRITHPPSPQGSPCCPRITIKVVILAFEFVKKFVIARWEEERTKKMLPLCCISLGESIRWNKANTELWVLGWLILIQLLS